MATLVELAKRGVVTEEVKRVASSEKRNVDFILNGLSDGSIVIPANVNHRRRKDFIPKGIGTGLTTKVNANIGTSADIDDINFEIEKLRVAVKFGADAVMDLSTGNRIVETRKAILEHCPVMLGTVPIYQAAKEAAEKYGFIGKMKPDDLFKVIESQCRDGVDFVTVHCGVTFSSLNRLKNEGRIMNIVSRGGAFMAVWMVHNEMENPLYENFDRLLDIAKKYDVTLSLGDGLRPGCIKDATDRCQIEELITLGELVDRAREANVQVMVEGPGHVPMDQIEANMVLEKSLCHKAPFYVLGPIVTDIAPGYDHITGAIGGAIAAKAGADFLCYITPAEHLALPNVDDVKRGVIATKIAAHAADIANNIPGATERDTAMAEAREDLNWEKQFELAIDPEIARMYRKERNPSDSETCTMCGKFCAIKQFRDYIQHKEK